MSSTPARGAAGKFISKEQAENVSEKDLPSLVHKSSEMTGALKTLKQAREDEEIQKPLVSVSVNNPFAWLLKWINYLRKKQTTTFTFRMGVPLIALPVLIAGFATVFFTLGKITTPQQENVIEKSPESYFLSKVGILKIIPSENEDLFYLILSEGTAIKLQAPANTDLKKLEGKRILATGTYTVLNNTLVVDKVADMEVLPISPKLLPTISVTETPTPSSETIPSLQ
jgi:hypothetical protein